MKNVRANLLLKVGLRGRAGLRELGGFVDVDLDVALDVDESDGLGCGTLGFAAGFKIDTGSLAGTGVGLLAGGGVGVGLPRGNAMVFSGSLAGAALDAPVPAAVPGT